MKEQNRNDKEVDVGHHINIKELLLQIITILHLITQTKLLLLRKNFCNLYTYSALFSFTYHTRK